MNFIQFYIEQVTNTKQIMIEQQSPANQNYSLQADLATGWKPKMKIIGPMPLNFDNLSLDYLIKPLIHSDTSIYEVIYLGLRPRDTFQMHSFLAKNYRYKFRHLLTTDYSHLKPFFKKFYSQFQPEFKMPFNGMNPKMNNSIIFQSRFESGNLDCVIRNKTKQYDLFLRIDSNTKGHIMWYYFKVMNKSEKAQTIRLNICNLRRSKTFYDNCMKPFIYRVGTGWKQQQNNMIISEDKVSFYKQHFIFTNETVQQPIVYRKLSFDLNLKPHEQVEVAYSIPYTYSQLIQDIKELKTASKQSKIEFDIDMSNISLSGLEIPYIKIYKNNDESEEIKKQTIFIIGRQHPGESNGSHVLKGFMTQLIKSKQKIMEQIRNHFVFHIVPMLNPDGVLIGNFRTSLYGKDLNRLFRKNQTLMIPEIQFCKNLIFQITRKKKKKIFMFLDFHGHSVKKNAFCFAPSTFQTNSLEDIREFPRLISEVTQMFRFPSCSFRISNNKKTTARAVFCNDANLCYTIETSNWCYYSKKNKLSILFEQKSWQRLGQHLIQSLAIFFARVLQRKQMRRRKMQSKIQKSKILQHNASGVLKAKILKKVHIKTQQNSNDFESSMNIAKIRQISNSYTQKIIPASTRQIKQTELKSRNEIMSQQLMANTNANNEPEEEKVEGSIEGESDDSDESDRQDMDKEKFKQYINVATKMFIQFQKAYYGDQYTARARYEIPKKMVSKKKQKQPPAIILQACLKSKNKIERKTLQSQKNLVKLGFSEQKTDLRSRIKKLQESSKKNHFVVSDLNSKEQALNILPRISIVNYLAYEDIDQKPKIFKIPKIESVHIKNIRKY